MSLREVGWGIFLVGLPFVHFVLSPDKLNQWHAQTLWAQGWIAVFFGLSLAHLGNRVVRNRPLGCWFAWICLSVIATWFSYLKQQQHPIGILPPFLHCLCLVAFYQAAVTQWTPEFLNRLLTWIAYAGIFLVAYGFLQAINFDQFYKWLDGTKTTDTVIGTMGNPTHFGTHLALLLPIFLWQPHWWWKLVAGLSGVLIFLTHSTSALACGYAVLLWWSWQEARHIFWILTVAGTLGGLWMILKTDWMNPSGRLEAWSAFWQRYLVGDGKQQITGAGIGRIMDDSLRNFAGWPRQWRHAHCEYLQILIEQGVIGLGLVLWGIGEAIGKWWRLPRTSTAKTLAGIGLVFLLASLVNFPAHLWVLASMGLMAYVGIYVLALESKTV